MTDNEQLLQAISDMMDSKLQNFATKDTLDAKLTETENNILTELDRVQVKTNEHFERVEKRLDNIELTMRSIKLENSTVNLLVETVSDLKDKVDQLEQKIS